MFTETHRRDLEENGYAVIDKVLTTEFCNSCVSEYTDWTNKFVEKCSWPFSSNSLIQRYKIGHARASWKVRLAVKPIFSALWKTEKLLTSFDAVAIGRPPENGEEEFHRANQHWLHTDQSANQLGLHTIQGAVYLESAECDDWTFVVLEKSHKYHQEFMTSHPKAYLRSSLNYIYRLREGEVEWFENNGCQFKRIPVQKGGVVLWDSRLMHANAKPVTGRKNPGRFRRVVFVCMGPAIWASDLDLQQKKTAYNNAWMTTHPPCQNIGAMPESIPSFSARIMAVDKLPEIARCDTVKLLSGVLKHDFKDGRSNGPDWKPQWRNGYNPRYSAYSKFESWQPFYWISCVVFVLLAVTILKKCVDI